MAKFRCLLILAALLVFSTAASAWAAEAPTNPQCPPTVAPADQAAFQAIFTPVETSQEPAEPALPPGLRIEDLTPRPLPMACTNSWCQSLGCYICRNGLCLC